MASVAKFDTWQAADGTNVARFNAGALEVWDGSAWSPASPGAAVISGTTGSPTITSGTAIGGVTYDVYEFTGSGSITVSTAGFADILVIGGGGSGGAMYGSGGGAGGHYSINNVYLPSGTAVMTVGAGGAAPVAVTGSAPAMGFNGNGSRLGPYFVPGGGGGVGFAAVRSSGNYYSHPGNTGGSGSGASGFGSGSSGAAGGVSIAGLGNIGGIGGNLLGGGGGGGAGAAGSNASGGNGGNGGTGLANSITGISVTRAGGGGGAGTGSNGSGGSGGGGSAASNPGGSGSANTGGGGGGSVSDISGSTGGAGGSGLVIVRVAV